jgi:hypothetical protein
MNDNDLPDALIRQQPVPNVSLGTETRMEDNVMNKARDALTKGRDHPTRPIMKGKQHGFLPLVELKTRTIPA